MDGFKCGWEVGTGSAINVQVGFIPDRVEIINVTDGDRIDIYTRGRAMAFTSGGTNTIAAGSVLTGATSGATLRVRQVLLASGTWAGGDAAGFFIADEEDVSGTFTSENVYISSGVNLANPVGTNDATVTVDTDYEVVITTAVASGTPSGTITAYAGSQSSGYAKGFTIGATTSESGKLLRWFAQRAFTN